jgi:two-component system chemotaxis response regulator CheY
MAHRILIVDDDPASRFIYRQVLNSFELLEAGDGAQALDLLRDQRFDLVILDMLLPRIQGIEVLEYIYGEPDLARMRVLVITAHDGYSHLALRQGDMVLLKPITPKQLREITSRSLVSSYA